MLSAGLARAAGHTCQNTLLGATARTAVGSQQAAMVLVRGMAAKPAQTTKKSSQSFKGNRNNDRRKAKPPRGVSMYTALPTTQLTHPLFQSENRKALDLPSFVASPAAIGQAMEFVLPEHDPVRIFGLPKSMLLEFRILSKPCSVVRGITVEAADIMDKAKNGSSLDTRLVLTGRAGCGKSFLMLQTVEHCVNNGWIVIYIPRAVQLMNSTTKHEYDLRTQTYHQPVFQYQTLQRLLTVNRSLLASLPTQTKHVFEKREIPVGTSLVDLIQIAFKEPGLSPTILDALLKELEQQTKMPVLMAVDDVQAVYCTSAYRDPHFQPIRPYHLSLPRMVLEYAAGKRAFRRGAFLGSITASETVYKAPLELAEALELPLTRSISPLDKRSRQLMEYTKGLKALKVPDALTVDEAASLCEVWMRDGAVVPTALRDEVFLGKYTESSGNARDFVWRGLLASLEL